MTNNDVIAQVESTFDFELSFDEIEELGKTARDLVDLVENLNE